MKYKNIEDNDVFEVRYKKNKGNKNQNLKLHLNEEYKPCSILKVKKNFNTEIEFTKKWKIGKDKKIKLCVVEAQELYLLLHSLYKYNNDYNVEINETE
jgi:hypothetical protein